MVEQHVRVDTSCGSTLGARAGGEEVGDFLGPWPTALAISVIHAEGTLVACRAAN